MKVLKVQKAKSSQLHPAFDQIQTFELDDKPFDSGAFGAVYFCHSANGKPLPVPQVVKILIDDGSGSAKAGIRTIQNLQDKIIQHNAVLKSNNQKSIEQINCLYALPQVSYEGDFNGKTVFGYSQNRLNTKEFVLFKDYFDEPDLQKKKKLREDFGKTTVAQRLQLGYDLAEGFQTLRDMAYIHADLNPKNLFIRLDPPALTLIDYDSGVVVNNPNDEADTFGQMGGWIAPEIQLQLMQSNSGLIQVDLNTDTWAVAVAIHYLLFLFHPLDFLKVRGEKNMKLYFSKFRWPEFDKKDPGFRQELTAIYEKYRQLLPVQLPASVLKAFDVTINEGYFNPGKRVTYRQWLRALTDKSIPVVSKKPAEIISFFAQKLQVSPGEKVVVTWQVKDAVKLTFNGQSLSGTDLNRGNFTIQPYVDSVYLLEATGTDGSLVRNVLSIKVLNGNTTIPVIPKTAPANPTPTVIVNNNPIVSTVSSIELNIPNYWLQGIFSWIFTIITGIAGYFFVITNFTNELFFGALGMNSIWIYFLNEKFSKLQAKVDKDRIKEELNTNNSEKNNIEKKLKTLQLELEKAEKEEQRQKQELENEIRILEQKERSDKQILLEQLQRNLQPIQDFLQVLKKQEEEELRQETEKLYQKVLDRELFKYLIVDADIDGFQLLFKTALTINGIFTAADFTSVDNQGNILKRNGEWVRLNALTSNKVLKLWQWREKVVSDIRKRFPQALSPELKNGIRKKYTTQIQDLSKKESDLQQKYASDFQNIANSYTSQIARLQINGQQTSINEKNNIEEDIRRQKQTLIQLESNRNVFGSRLDQYKNISFGKYLAKVFFIQ